MDQATRRARRDQASEQLARSGVLTLGSAVRFRGELEILLLCTVHVFREFVFFSQRGGNSQKRHVMHYDAKRDMFVPSFTIVHTPSDGFMHCKQAFRYERPTILESSVYNHTIGDAPSKWSYQFPAIEFYQRLEAYVQEHLSPRDQYTVPCGVFWRISAVHALRAEFIAQLVSGKQYIAGITRGDPPPPFLSLFPEYAQRQERMRNATNIVPIAQHIRPARAMPTHNPEGAAVIAVDFHARDRRIDMTP